MKKDRIPCLVPGCGRTAPADKYPPGTEIICRKHFRALPSNIRDGIRRLERRKRFLLRRWRKRGVENPDLLSIDNALSKLWDRVYVYYRRPDKPAGLDAFLEEVGL